MNKCKVENCLEPGTHEITISVGGGNHDPYPSKYIVPICGRHYGKMGNFGPDWFSLEEK